jgi:hypothetical protein
LSNRKGVTIPAHRIASRFQAAVVLREDTSTEVIFSDGGVLTANDLRRLLEPQFGPLLKMRLRPSLTGLPNTVAWEALSENAEFVTGRVVLHASVETTRIVVWAEVLVDQRAVGIRIAMALPRQLLEDRLRRIAARARKMIQEVRVQPQVPALAIISDLEKLLEIADLE